VNLSGLVIDLALPAPVTDNAAFVVCSHKQVAVEATQRPDVRPGVKYSVAIVFDGTLPSGDARVHDTFRIHCHGEDRLAAAPVQ
jgi:hypothetical protein